MADDETASAQEPGRGDQPGEVGELALPDEAVGTVVLAEAGGFRLQSATAGRFLGERLQDAGFAVLVIDLLNPGEESEDAMAEGVRFDVLAERAVAAIDRAHEQLPTAGLPVGAFGVDSAAAGTLLAAAERPDSVRAVVSCGGRPDLLPVEARRAIAAPTLLMVDGDGEPGRYRAVVGDLGSPASTVEVIAGAGGLDNPGAVEVIAELAIGWFKRHLASGMPAATETAGG
jgi:putative phosphoribosyl transferase